MDDQPNGSMRPADGGQVERRRLIPEEPSKIFRNISAAIWAIILVALIVFIFQNWETVPFKFLFWNFNTKLSWALLLATILGIVIGVVVPFAIRRRRKAATKANQV